MALINPDAPQDQRVNKIIQKYNDIIKAGVPGTSFYVDSGRTGASDANTRTGTVKTSPLATIDEANDRCTANNGDYIFVAPGHNEEVKTVGGLNLDTAGITIVFEGEGADRAKITFSDLVGADMNVDAASITLVRPRFVAAIDALTGPVDVNAADFTIVDGLYEDATNIDTTDCIVSVPASVRMHIFGMRYQEGNAGGTQKQSFIQMNGVDNAILADIDIRGDFGTGNVENVTDELLNVRLDNMFLENTNSGPQPGIVLDTNCDGLAKDILIRIVSGTTYVSSQADINWHDSFGTQTDGSTFGDPIGASTTGGLESKLDIITDFHTVPVQDTTDDAQMRDVIGKKDDTAAAGAVSTTESGIAYHKQNVTANIAITALHGVPVADTTDDVNMRDVVGKKDDAAAAGTVTTTESGMAYHKQNVTNTEALVALHVVPVADTTDDANMRDVVGKKDDAAAAGAVTTTESGMAYHKQNVTNTEAIVALHVVPVADTTDDANMRDVVGKKDDAAAVGAVSTTESGMAYHKQNVTNTEAILVDTSTTLPGLPGTCHIIQKTIVCSTIPDDGGSPQAAPLTGAASGDLMLEEIIFQTDSATGLVGPTVMQVISDNTDGLTGNTTPIWAEAVANLGAGKTINNPLADTMLLPIMLESGKILYINGDNAVGTGAGTVEVIMKFRRITAAATIAAA